MSLHFWRNYNPSLLPLFYMCLCSPGLLPLLTRPQTTVLTTVRKRSSRLRSVIRPYAKHKRRKQTRIFRFLPLFALIGKQQLSKTTIPLKIKPVLDFSEIFSKIQFQLQPFFHPLTGTKLHLNSVELKWKKSWKAFIEKFFVKRKRRWYLWYGKTLKNNRLLQSLNDTLPRLVRFLKRSKRRRDPRWPRRRYFLDPINPPATPQLPERPFFFNHMFYFYRLRLPYKRLRFIGRHYWSLYPKNVTVFKFKNPYYFLHLPFDVINEVVPTLSWILDKFQLCRALKKTYKKLSWRTRRKAYRQIRHLSWFYASRRIVRRLRRRLKKLRYKSKFKYVKLPVIQFNEQTVMPKTLDTKIIGTSTDNSSPSCLNRITTAQLLRTLRGSLKRWKRRRSSYRYKIREWAHVLRVVRRTRRLRRNRIKFTNIYAPSLKNMVGRALKKAWFFPAWKLEQSQSQPSWTAKISRLVQLCCLNPLRNKWLSSFSSINGVTSQPRLYIHPEEKVPFVLSTLGFLFLSRLCYLNCFHNSIDVVYKLRRLKYSFPLRDEFPKHVLRKYNHTRLFVDNFLQFRLGQKLANHVQPQAVGATFLGYEENWADSFFSNTSLGSSLIYPAADLTSPALSKFEFRFLDKFYRPAYTLYTTRFKPGYMRLWRRARRSLQVRTKTTFRYQHQLTHYLLMFKRGVHLPTVANDEFKVQNLLMKSRLILDKANARLFILRKVVFINGLLCSNINFQLCAGDFLQLIVSFKYYITFRWLLSHDQKLKVRIRTLSKKIKKKKAAQNPDKKYRKHTPLWVSRHSSLLLDVAKYMEVDFFTLSAFVLHDPLYWNDINVYADTILKPQIFNMYNWKYIN